MNEIQLSNDLNIITNEILQYGSTINISYWEVGRRLRHVKENNLTHGNFMEYLKKIKIDYSDANRLMSISKMPELATWQNLPKRNLFLISKLPSEEQTKPQTLESGETKLPSEMNVKELEEVNKKNRELEKQLKSKDDQIATQARMIDDLSEQEPQVVEKTVEVAPSDYEQLKASNNDLQKQLSSVQNDLKMKKMQYDLLEENTASAKKLEANIEALRKKEKSIDQRIKATMEFNSLMNEIETFFDKKMASLRFKPLVNELHDTEATNQLSDVVNSVDFWVSEMRKILPNEQTKIIEGEIING